MASFKIRSHLHSPPGWAWGPCRLHLRKMGHIRIAQNKIDIRMRNQSTLSIYYIGMPCLSDFDLGYNVPNELEINLCNNHPVFTTESGHR